jgi:endonuclease/exonuclease/phosphatase family metal-dependent hydrolase
MTDSVITGARPVIRRYARLVLLGGSALGLAGVVLLVIVRLTGMDAGTVLALPISGLPYATIGTVVLLVIVAALRSRSLIALAVVLLVMQLVWLLPRFVPSRTEVPADAARLRVGSSNTYMGRIDPGALVGLVRSERLDVLAVQELRAGVLTGLDAAGIGDLLPYREIHPGSDSAIYSRFPLTNGGALDQPTLWPQTTAEIQVGGHAVRLVSVHTYFPLGDPDRWTRDFAALTAGATGAPPNLVVIGDFNATLDHAPMRELLHTGLTDTHTELGRGWSPTWPANSTIPPLIQIDHILHGPALVAVSAAEHTLPGTEHRAITAELAVIR